MIAAHWMFSVAIDQLDFSWTVFMEIIFQFSEKINVEVLITLFSCRDVIKTTLRWPRGYIHNMFSF